MKERRYDIDWLRVIAMLSVFVFHVTRFFDNEDWHVKAPIGQQTEIVVIVRSLFFWVWLMEIFFLLSGFATLYSLRHHTGGQYLLERAKRLLIPLYTVGMFLIVVPQAYFERYTHGQITTSFWEWLPKFYLGLPGEVITGLDPQAPSSIVLYTFTGHLWFLQMLFIVSLVTLPVILWLKSESGQGFTTKLAGWSMRPGGIFLFAIPLAIVRIGLNWLPWTVSLNWMDFLWYVLYFIFGYILVTDARFNESIKKNGWLSLALWFLPFAIVLSILRFVFGYMPGTGFSVWYMIFELTWTIVSWSSVVCILSLGAKYLNFTNRFLEYGNEAVLPFYILHQTFILVVGWFVFPLGLNAFVEYFIILVVSFALIMLTYEFLIRRWNFMRFLFGMNPKKKVEPAMSNGRSQQGA